MVKQIILIVIAFGMGFFSARMLHKKEKIEIENIKAQYNKKNLYYQIMNMWLEMRQKGETTVSYLQTKGIKRIAIYGMKELGERFYEDVKNTDIEVICVIDKKPQQVLGDFMVISPEEEIPEVDAIIVTADYHFQEIKEQMSRKVTCPVYSLNGVLGNSFGRNF